MSYKDWDSEVILPLNEISQEWKDYQARELAKEQSSRWAVESPRRAARELYGSEMGKTAFVIGCGPSIERAEKYLLEAHEGSFRIAINRAITKIPAEYCSFIDYTAYQAISDCENFKKSIKIGVDRFQRLLPTDVYIAERAYELSDLKKGKLIHRSASLLMTLHLCVWLGATRIVTVGCDNRISPDCPEDLKSINQFTYDRINASLLRDTRFWLPSWCSLADASDGDLILGKTYINQELEKLNVNANGDKVAGATAG